MKVAVTASGNTLESPLDPRFGRCPYFLLVETDDLSFEAIENPNVSRDSAAGTQAAQLVADKGVRFVLAGNCGPNAYQTLSAAGLTVILGCSGTIRDVIANFKSGRYSAAEQPNVASHFGTGPTFASTSPSSAYPSPSGFPPGTGIGTGMGMGRGQGGGFGRGMGRGGGMERGMGRGGAMADPPSSPQPQPAPQSHPNTAQELAALKAQAQAVEEQLAALNERIGQVRNDAAPRRLVAVVDADRCLGCGLCAQVCPAGAITMNDVASIDIGKCTACGQCAAECPHGVISLMKV